VNLDVIKPWIKKKLIEILGVEDDVVMQYVLNMLESEKVKPAKNIITVMQNVRCPSFDYLEMLQAIYNLLLYLFFVHDKLSTVRRFKTLYKHT